MKEKQFPGLEVERFPGRVLLRSSTPPEEHYEVICFKGNTETGRVVLRKEDEVMFYMGSEHYLQVIGYREEGGGGNEETS